MYSAPLASLLLACLLSIMHGKLLKSFSLLFPLKKLAHAPAGTSAQVISCPADQNVNNDAGMITATVTFSVTPVDATCDRDSGSKFPLGTTTVFCTYFNPNDAMDETCAFDVVVTDSVDPVIVCPANIADTTDPGLNSGLSCACSALLSPSSLQAERPGPSLLLLTTVV
jgi:hypothetical protein